MQMVPSCPSLIVFVVIYTCKRCFYYQGIISLIQEVDAVLFVTSGRCHYYPMTIPLLPVDDPTIMYMLNPVNHLLEHVPGPILANASVALARPLVY